MRRALEDGTTVVAPGVYDAITARLMRHLGFSALYVSGAQTATALGLQEALMTLTQVAEVAERVVKAVGGELPVIVDAETGYGEAVHIMEAVKQLEEAGVTAIHLEDQVFPPRVSHRTGGEHIVPLDIYRRRLEYALRARRSRDFLIIGRTNALRAGPQPGLPEGGGRAEALKRARAAVEVGVDVVMISRIPDRAHFEFFRAELPNIPLLGLISPGYPDLPEYEALGYRLIIYPNITILTTLRALHGVYAHVRATGTLPPGTLAQAAETRDLVDTLLGVADLEAIEEETT
jgi:2-methylisocitrate lyase-like PEP mutase family enzyme